MTRHVKSGFRMVLVPGAGAYLQYIGDPEATVPARACDLLNELVFLENVPCARSGIMATIATNRLGDWHRGLTPD